MGLRADPPSGTITSLFSDIEGSTALVQKLGEDSVPLFERHRALLRAAFARHDGFEQGTEGDGFFVVFAQPADAVAAALEAQRALAREPWSAGEEIRVRIGVHTGAASWRDGDYWGMGIHEAARVGAVGHGGQVVVSGTTAAALSDLPQGASLRDLGAYRLKDVTEPLQLFQLQHPELVAEFPPLRTLAFHEHNLPAQRTPLFGREALLTDLAAKLANERLLTLTGVGGTGKTRLALQLAANHVHDYRDGAFFADLAVVTDPELVAVTAAQALGVPSQHSTDGDAVADLAAYAASRQVLLILDNCEHVLDAAGALCDVLLERAPGVKMLVTSREPLGVDGEAVARVPSLEQGPAERLFRDRASRAGGSLADDAATDDGVAQIARRLDGVPLAIELAAARCAELSVSTIAQLLDDRFRVLTGGVRKSQQRHQTMLATLEWSHNLLTEEEQMFFRRLAVFPGDFAVDAAAAVCMAGDSLAAVAILGSLVKKSLVAFDGDRYRLLETLRLFAETRLAQAGEADVYRSRHTEWVITAAGALRLSDVESVFLLLDDVRAALAWCEGAGEFACGARVVGAAAPMWFALAISDEVAPWLERARAIDESLDTEARLAWRYAEHWVAIINLDTTRMLSLADEVARLDPGMESAVGVHSAWLRAVTTGWRDPASGLAQLEALRDAPGWERVVSTQAGGGAETVANARGGLLQIAGRFDESITTYESAMAHSARGAADYTSIDRVVALALAGRPDEAINAAVIAKAHLHPREPHFTRLAAEAALAVAVAASDDIAASAASTVALFDLIARDYSRTDTANGFAHAACAALCRFAGQWDDGARIVAGAYRHGYVGRWLGGMGVFALLHRELPEVLGERWRTVAAKGAAMEKDELLTYARTVAERLASA